MLNIIVSTGLTNEPRGIISSDRIFEYTEKQIRDELRPSGKIDFEQLKKFPTLFMEEGTGDEIAGLGWIQNVEEGRSTTSFTFRLDPELSRLRNSELLALASEFQLDGFEFHRNHWAVKDVDIFRVLYREEKKKRQTPSVFTLSEKPVDPRLISFMMPFDESFRKLYDGAKARLETAGYTCRRADDFWHHVHIIQDIIELICTSQVIVCDLSGKNPSVFYEAGIAHTLGKQVILITQHADDVPFDLRPLRYISYHNNSEGIEALTSSLLSRLQTVAPLRAA